MLRTGLVDEISLPMHPVLIGGTSPKLFFKSEELKDSEGIIILKLMNCENMGDDPVWLRDNIMG